MLDVLDAELLVKSLYLALVCLWTDILVFLLHADLSLSWQVSLLPRGEAFSLHIAYHTIETVVEVVSDSREILAPCGAD